MTEPWPPPACRTPPPCCPRPADCSSPRSSHCGRCRWATGPPAPPSHLRGRGEAHAQVTGPTQSPPRPPGRVFYFLLLPHLRLNLQVCERSRGLFGTSCQKQFRSRVRGSKRHVALFWRHKLPRGSSSLGRAYARLSLPCCLGGWRGVGRREERGKCPPGLASLQGGSVCDHVMSALALQPSSFHITGGSAVGGGGWWGGVSKEICFIRTDGSLFLFVCVGESDTRGCISFAKQATGDVCVFFLKKKKKKGRKIKDVFNGILTSDIIQQQGWGFWKTLLL